MFQNILNAQLDSQKPNNLNIICTANLLTLKWLRKPPISYFMKIQLFQPQCSEKAVFFQLFQPKLKIRSIFLLFHLLQLFQPCGNPVSKLLYKSVLKNRVLLRVCVEDFVLNLVEEVQTNSVSLQSVFWCIFLPL